jgi:hypothetical protein
MEIFMRKVLWVCLVFLLAAGSVLPAHAANAEFQGNCTNSTPGGTLRTDCVFNAGRTPSGSSPTTCSPSSITSYFWDYGDGTDSGFTSSSSASHTYFGAGDWTICLSVFCANGSSDTTCHCMINNIGINGCILPGAGWTP